MNILLTGAFNYSSDQLKEIESIGYKITYIKEERKKLELDVSTFEVVVCNNLFLHNDIKDFKNLKVIQLTSAGLDRVPIDYIKDNNIKLFNARGVYSKPIAEWTILKILEVYKKTNVFIKQQKNKKWIKHYDIEELTNKNVAILGYGDIANEIAKRLVSFETNIYAFDIIEPKSSYHIKYDNIKNVNNYLKEMDIVISTLPYIKETDGLINIDFLTHMKPNALLVNVSRGKVVNEDDLINHLIKNKHFNAILDVFEEEPLKNNNKLWELDNVLITPHNSYASNTNNKRLYELIIRNIKEF